MANVGIDAVLANCAIETLLREANRYLQSRDVVRVEQLCRNALATEPSASDAWHLLAIALAEQNRFRDAAHAAQRATALLPSNAAYWVTRGIIASSQNLLKEAQTSFLQALRINPKLSEASYLLGRSYHRADMLEDAIAAYRKALRGAPEVPEIRFHLARALLQADRAEEALAAFQAAFVRDREGRLDRRECLDCFGRLPIKPLPSFWQTEVTAFFSRQDIDKSRYAMGGIYVLMTRPAFRGLLAAGHRHKSIKPDPTAVSQVMSDPLFGVLLRDAVLVHPQFEFMLTWLRSELLWDGALRARAPLQFLCDLALQCFNNEFVYAESETETAKVSDLSLEIEEGLGGAPHDEQFMRSLALFAMYRPLHRLARIEALPTEIPEAGAARLLLQRTVGDALEERRLRSSIPAIGQIGNAVSREVRAQYEEHPYPRWIAFDRDPPGSVSGWIASEISSLSLQLDCPTPYNILVGGCGTGIEAISLAAKIADVRVTAVDLSLSSLAYAKRKANELGLTNIEFHQADILELGQISERFDAVLSVGVLHHMREPHEGLGVLARLARPGGLLKIGLYSQRARSSVNAIRQIIRERQLAPADAAIRAFRQEVLASGRDDPALTDLLRWRDFFTMSGCRDLLFHVEEHQFTLPQIADMLRSYKLAVLGVSRHLPRESVLAYRQLDPDGQDMANLQIWDAVEARLPGTFEDMYNMWCCAPPSSTE
jgi:SAM-dependent methyltransferase